MDPVTLSGIITLVIMLIDLAKQIQQRIPRAEKRFDELAAFLLVLNYEGREPTPEELFRFTSEALAADAGVQGALQRLRDAKSANDAAKVVSTPKKAAVKPTPPAAPAEDDD